jgi:DNA primase
LSLPPHFLEELKQRVSVSDIVQRRVKLIKRGREFVGLSPFNAEKSPSFTVNDEKGFYHCFSSGEHGDILSFLMNVEGMAFMEAVETCAGIAGMDVPQATPEEHARAEQAKGMREANTAAAHFFEQQLRMPEGAEAMAYLQRRGLAEPTMRRFQLGYAPQDRMALMAYLRREGFEDDVLVDAGLARRADDGRVYGYFKDRVIFPIMDARGRCIAFGARALGDAQPKYLNSPDSPLFQKGDTLYGLDLAREPGHKAGEIVVVEGYMDVIALSEAGIPNAVAPLGTAITENQIKRLWKIAARPTLCMDGDAAGRRAAGRAALRCLPILIPGRSLKFALLTGGQDPDEMVREQGAEALNEAFRNAESLADVVWADALAEIDATQPEQRAEFDKRLHDLARGIQDETVRRYFTDEVRTRLRKAFGEEAPPKRTFERGGDWRKRDQGPPARRLPRPAVGARVAARSIGEGRLTYVLLRRPDLAEPLAERLALIRFADPALDSLRAALVQNIVRDPGIDAQALRNHLTHAGLAQTLSLLEADIKRRRPPAILQEGSEDIAIWLNQAISAMERDEVNQEIQRRARSLNMQDDRALQALDSEMQAVFRER